MSGEAERARLGEERSKFWGPYVSERAWGTVREDYSAGGTAWEDFPHDQARSRAYRWSEDGLGALCDIRQRLCLGFAFWNGHDPILKERIFGLTGNEGNHGEDAKEYWWYLDSTPSHSWMRWRYHYPRQAFPYDDLVSENRRRGKFDPEYELLDTGALDDYWQLTVDYAKAADDDVCIRVSVRNAGPDEATLHVLPTLWFRNTWSWTGSADKPSLVVHDSAIAAAHDELDPMVLSASGDAELLFCDNESNARRLWGVDGAPYPKDAINDHVVSGSASVNPAQEGTKAAFHHVLTVAGGETAELRLRFAPEARDLDATWEAALTAREAEADDFYASIVPAKATPEIASVMRQGFAGMLWSKQIYHYDVEKWLDGDPAGPPPPDSRKGGRNARWRHLSNFDILSMPDKWEYPWYAAWDLAFHCVALAQVDPDFAKNQLVLICREWYMHPNGQVPAYEWAFDDVNPPVHAWAALRIFEIDGSKDFEFLERVLHKLMLNFSWWVNRKDVGGDDVFEGGFLGLDNVGPFDRSASMPGGGFLEQSDGTSWMAMYCLNLLEMSLLLAERDDTYEDIATKFFEHFARIAWAINNKGLWDEQDGFYYDVLRMPDGRSLPVRVRSIVGLIPLYAVTVLSRQTLDRLPRFAERLRDFVARKPEYAEVANISLDDADRLLSIVSPDRLKRILETLLDEEEFFSPFGVRSVSRFHRDHPYAFSVDGTTAQLDYEPGESQSGLFGGNSNWRGPVWFPVNYLVIEALRRFYAYTGDALRVESPAGSGTQASLADVANQLSERLVSVFLQRNGARPSLGASDRFQHDPAWGDQLLFFEYFHGDSGAGLGASHQTGWTGLVADLVVDAGWLKT
ncbi:MGH1-like glycoside hydrolase domain-containing protein [Solirubrobacter ginsenosidimutans]|uniref:MGH1-like glycoside hydrolase domain-containing protein n=1 Tax=Solirubrobacter ginsenosidimutans TaxID=490573 RepID=UPI0022CE223B|nr:hypothetical protein [Solirubrobacter ginsenosidimutans]